MAGEDKYLDYYVFWCYFILIIVNSVITAMGYDDETLNKLITLAAHGGVFWYWYKDKNYKLLYWVFAGVAAFAFRFVFALVLVEILPYNWDYEDFIVLAVLKCLVGIVFSFTGSYFYQLFKIKSYKNQNKQQNEQ